MQKLILVLLTSTTLLVPACSESSVVNADGAKRDDPERINDGVVIRASDGGAPPLEAPDEVLIDPDAPACGDGTVNDGEACDDANTESGDGCAGDCAKIEDGYLCRVEGAPCERAKVCGDGLQTEGEECDDGNNESDDGCTLTCRLEKDYACPEPGEPCISTVKCGDSAISGDEECDDGNGESGDGCDAACLLEPGFECSNQGASCRPVCGDATVVGREECDDGNDDSGDGCSAACTVEVGWVCDEPGAECRTTTCGDGVVEGSEPCDDGGNWIVGDGCSPGCVLEPDCSAGACVSLCGDGLILAGDDEECDDGNTESGDGCSAECQIEDGYACVVAVPDEDETLELPILFRDFIHAPVEDAIRHPDFQEFTGDDVTPGLVAEELSADGKPIYTGLCELDSDFARAECPYGPMTTSEENFDQWYRDTPDVNLPLLSWIPFQPQADGTYVFEDEGGFFPFDDAGWVAEGLEQAFAQDGEDPESPIRNYGFTSELRNWFEYQGDEFLEFAGDDDVWVFIGGKLAVDIGGLHPRRVRSVTLDEATGEALGLELGRVYEVVLFHAERRRSQSNFKLTLKGFAASRTECASVCGDGIVAGEEDCDDGEDNGGGYGFCSDDCTLGPRCGDGIVNEDSPEECDNGLNLDGYDTGDGACAPGCVPPPSCGDGFVDVRFGEECDEGSDNDGSYGGCAEDCSLAPYCGDGVKDEGEECDDGNNKNDDTCDVECHRIDLGPAL